MLRGKEEKSQATKEINISKTLDKAYGRYRKGKYREAISLCNDILNNQQAKTFKGSSLAFVYILLGDCNVKLENYDEAILDFKNAITNNPAYPHTFFKLASTHLSAKQFIEAKKIFAKGMLADIDGKLLSAEGIALALDNLEKIAQNEIEQFTPKDEKAENESRTEGFKLFNQLASKALTSRIINAFKNKTVICDDYYNRGNFFLDKAPTKAVFDFIFSLWLHLVKQDKHSIFHISCSYIKLIKAFIETDDLDNAMIVNHDLYTCFYRFTPAQLSHLDWIDDHEVTALSLALSLPLHNVLARKSSFIVSQLLFDKAEKIAKDKGNKEAFRVYFDALDLIHAEAAEKGSVPQVSAKIGVSTNQPSIDAPRDIEDYLKTASDADIATEIENIKQEYAEIIANDKENLIRAAQAAKEKNERISSMMNRSAAEGEVLLVAPENETLEAAKNRLKRALIHFKISRDNADKLELTDKVNHFHEQITIVETKLAQVEKMLSPAYGTYWFHLGLKAYENKDHASTKAHFVKAMSVDVTGLDLPPDEKIRALQAWTDIESTLITPSESKEARNPSIYYKLGAEQATQQNPTKALEFYNIALWLINSHTAIQPVERLLETLLYMSRCNSHVLLGNLQHATYDHVKLINLVNQLDKTELEKSPWIKIKNMQQLFPNEELSNATAVKLAKFELVLVMTTRMATLIEKKTHDEATDLALRIANLLTDIFPQKNLKSLKKSTHALDDALKETKNKPSPEIINKMIRDLRAHISEVISTITTPQVQTTPKKQEDSSTIVYVPNSNARLTKKEKKKLAKANAASKAAVTSGTQDSTESDATSENKAESTSTPVAPVTTPVAAPVIPVNLPSTDVEAKRTQVVNFWSEKSRQLIEELKLQTEKASHSSSEPIILSVLQSAIRVSQANGASSLIEKKDDEGQNHKDSDNPGLNESEEDHSEHESESSEENNHSSEADHSSSEKEQGRNNKEPDQQIDSDNPDLDESEEDESEHESDSSEENNHSSEIENASSQKDEDQNNKESDQQNQSNKTDQINNDTLPAVVTSLHDSIIPPPTTPVVATDNKDIDEKNHVERPIPDYLFSSYVGKIALSQFESEHISLIRDALKAAGKEEIVFLTGGTVRDRLWTLLLQLVNPLIEDPVLDYITYDAALIKKAFNLQSGVYFDRESKIEKVRYVGGEGSDLISANEHTVKEVGICFPMKYKNGKRIRITCSQDLEDTTKTPLKRITTSLEKRDFNSGSYLADEYGRVFVILPKAREELANRIFAFNTILPPNISYHIDPIRMLRKHNFLSRYSAQQISLEEYHAMHQQAHLLLEKASPEIVNLWMGKLMTTGHAELGFAALSQYGIIQPLFPQCKQQMKLQYPWIISELKKIDASDRRELRHVYMIFVLCTLLENQEGYMHLTRPDYRLQQMNNIITHAKNPLFNKTHFDTYSPFIDSAQSLMERVYDSWLQFLTISLTIPNTLMQTATLNTPVQIQQPMPSVPVIQTPVMPIYSIPSHHIHWRQPNGNPQQNHTQPNQGNNRQNGGHFNQNHSNRGRKH